MDKYFKIALLACVLLIHCVISIYPQSSDYKFRHLTTKDGLSSNSILSILQDSRGFVWIGTAFGLDRYDGYKFIHYDQIQDSTDLSEKTPVNSLFEDNLGNIWIGTSNRGLYVFDPELDYFIHKANDPENKSSLYGNNILFIYQDRNNMIWFSTEGGELNRFDPANNSITILNPITSKGELIHILSMIEDEEGLFWIGTNQGIYHFDRISEQFYPFKYQPDVVKINKQIFCFHLDHHGDIWIGTLKGLFKFIRKENKVIQIISHNQQGNDHLGDDAVVSIQAFNELSGDNLWIASRNGLVNYDTYNDCFSRITIAPGSSGGLSNDYIEDLHLNDAGILWIATRWSGVNKIDTKGNPFKQVRLKSDQTGDYYSASAFYMDDSGNLWVGACDGGLFKFDPEMNKVAHYQYSAEKAVFIDIRNKFTNFIDCIFQDSENFIWLGAGGMGPVLFNETNKSFYYLDFQIPEDHQRPERTMDILQDRYGTVWVGTDRGLFKKDSGEKKFNPVRIIHHDILMHSSILDIYEDTEGNLFFATTRDGLFRLTPENRDDIKFDHFGGTGSNSPGLFETFIENVDEDVDGNIWAASHRGINKYDPENERFELLNDPAGLFSHGVRQVFIDQKGNLWISHQRHGLVRYNPENQQVKIFDSGDGLPFENFVWVYWFQSGDGRIFIGGLLGDGNGFFYFQPNIVKDNMTIPNIVITGFNVGNKPFSPGRNMSSAHKIKLKYFQNYFSFEFAALDYTDPLKNQYAYFMEGLENDWVFAGNRRFANYTGIPPGKYIFRVKGSNNDGYWNEAGTSIAISILPPPWKTWWAYMGYVIILIGLIILWRMYDLRRIRLQQQLEIEHVEAKKLKELDSMKSRFFTNISHEFRTPLTLILGPLQGILSKIADEDTKSELTLMQRNAVRLQHLINQMLDLSKLESGKMKLQSREENIVTLVNQYIQSFESYAKQKQIDLTFSSEDDVILLFVDKEKMEKVLYNLLSNAFKFTPAGGRVVVTVARNQSSVVSRQSSVVSRQSSVVSRQSSVVSRQSLVNNDTSTEDCRLKTVDLPENCTVISISDTGSGIAPDKLPHIFDRFYQADNSYSNDQEGTGIGLALAKELVELHHGEIRVESEVGVGTTFSVYLPLGKEHLREEEMDTSRQSLVVSQPPPRPSPNLDASPPGPLSNLERGNRGPGGEGGEAPLLLIVEDNADLRHYIRGFMEDSYSIVECGDGKAGFEKAAETIPDLVISDVMMPVMDGYELCEKLKTDERTSHIPVILLTARADIDSKIEGLETGADDFIAKPFDAEELLVRVKNLIHQRQKLMELFSKKVNSPESYLDTLQDGLISKVDRHFLKKAGDVVRENLHDFNFSAEAFSDQMNLSRMQLHRKLKALINQSAGDYIRTVRLTQAAGLLAEGSCSVTQVAFEVGFNNLSWFTKCFREKYGVLPSQYRKTIR